MDKGDGTMRPLSAKDLVKISPKDRADLFEKNEVLHIKNSDFKIVSIGKREMRIRLLPKIDVLNSQERLRQIKKLKPDG